MTFTHARHICYNISSKDITPTEKCQAIQALLVTESLTCLPEVVMAEVIAYLMKKQTPVKVTDAHVDEYYCPACRCENCCDQGRIDDNYCPVCGQRIYQNAEDIQNE